jgi:hypothetical protein
MFKVGEYGSADFHNIRITWGLGLFKDDIQMCHYHNRGSHMVAFYDSRVYGDFIFNSPNYMFTTLLF